MARILRSGIELVVITLVAITLTASNKVNAQVRYAEPIGCEVDWGDDIDPDDIFEGLNNAIDQDWTELRVLPGRYWESVHIDNLPEDAMLVEGYLISGWDPWSGQDGDYLEDATQVRILDAFRVIDQITDTVEVNGYTRITVNFDPEDGSYSVFDDTTKWIDTGTPVDANRTYGWQFGELKS